MGPFTFEFREGNNGDILNCEITLTDIPIPLQIVVIDTSKKWGPRLI
jgi:hypothetical protein